MPGLYGILNLGVRSLQAQSQGLAVAGQNLANVNNNAYTRQRLLLQTTSTLTGGATGAEGTGVTAAAILQVRSAGVDRQILTETSVSGFWTAQQSALDSAQTDLGELLDSTTQSAAGTAAAGGAGSSSGLAAELDAFFNEWDNLAASPESVPQRRVLLSRAASLASQFNQADRRLGDLTDSLNDSVDSDVSDANDILDGIATLNEQIRRAEIGRPGSANDLRDLRRQKIESLAGLVDVSTAETSDGEFSLSIGGTQFIDNGRVTETLATYDAGGNRRAVCVASSGSPLALTGGRIQGVIDVRDGALSDARSGINTLAATLIDQVNTLHRPGFGLGGTTGADFFQGTGAASIRVNSAIVSDPERVQAGATADAGDNQTALGLARLAQQTLPALGNQTLAGSYTTTVTVLGQALANANSQVEDQKVIQQMLENQRASVSGVSIDEEMTDLVKYQKAFQASARIISTVDEMLSEIINLKR